MKRDSCCRVFWQPHRSRASQLKLTATVGVCSLSMQRFATGKPNEGDFPSAPATPIVVPDFVRQLGASRLSRMAAVLGITAGELFGSSKLE